MRGHRAPRCQPRPAASRTQAHQPLITEEVWNVQSNLERGGGRRWRPCASWQSRQLRARRRCMCPRRPCSQAGRAASSRTTTASRRRSTPRAAKINVCPGTYTEQLTITKPVNAHRGRHGRIGHSRTARLAREHENRLRRSARHRTIRTGPGRVSICTSGTVSITGLTVEAKWPDATCDDSLYGILVAGGATLKATNVTVERRRRVPDQRAARAASASRSGWRWTTPVEVGHASLKGVTVTNYQKNGITIDGAGLDGENRQRRPLPAPGRRPRSPRTASR